MSEDWGNGVVVRQIWDDFGLGEAVNGWVPFGETWVPSTAEEAISSGSIRVDETALPACLTELQEACSDGQTRLGADIYQVMDKVFSQKPTCGAVLEETER